VPKPFMSLSLFNLNILLTFLRANYLFSYFLLASFFWQTEITYEIKPEEQNNQRRPNWGLTKKTLFVVLIKLP
jgi:hypothetical protein